MTHIIRHPKYYAELRKIYKQAEKHKQQASRVSSTGDQPLAANP